MLPRTIELYSLEGVEAVVEAIRAGRLNGMTGRTLISPKPCKIEAYGRKQDAAR
jgi:hypothetical protein